MYNGIFTPMVGSPSAWGLTPEKVSKLFPNQKKIAPVQKKEELKSYAKPQVAQGPSLVDQFKEARWNYFAENAGKTDPRRLIENHMGQLFKYAALKPTSSVPNEGPSPNATDSEDKDFKEYLDLLTSPMPTPTKVPLRGPSSGQVALGGLAALLMPKFAATALAAPFAAGLQRQELDQQRAVEDAQTAAQNRQSKLSALEAKMAMKQSQATQNMQQSPLDAPNGPSDSDFRLFAVIHANPQFNRAFQNVRSLPLSSRQLGIQFLRDNFGAALWNLDDGQVSRLLDLYVPDASPLERMKGPRTTDMENYVKSGDLQKAKAYAEDAGKGLPSALGLTTLVSNARDNRSKVNQGFGVATKAPTRTNLQNQQKLYSNAETAHQTLLTELNRQIEETNFKLSTIPANAPPEILNAKATHLDTLDRLEAMRAEVAAYLGRLQGAKTQAGQALAQLDKVPKAPSVRKGPVVPKGPVSGKGGVRVGNTLFGLTVQPGEEKFFNDLLRLRASGLSSNQFALSLRNFKASLWAYRARTK